MTNTKNILIAQRYSDALVELAKDGKLTFDEINKDLNTIKEILNNSKDLDAFLKTPLVSAEDKIEVIGKIFAQEINPLIVNFLKLIVEKNRFETLDEILTAFAEAKDNENNIKRVSVTSAIEMNEEAKEKLKNKLENKLNKNVIIDLNINPDIIAGLIIKIGDNVIDMSLKHKLEDLSKNIIK